MASTAGGPTRSQVNKAGQTVRRWHRAGRKLTPEWSGRVASAIDVIWEHRAAHQYPLVKANMGLRSRLKTAGCAVEVTQRLKRLSTILDKLVREPNMGLSTMQDIGGCRAVLDSVDEVRRVTQRLLQKRRAPFHVVDYIAKPRGTGYRAVHIVISYADRSGVGRAIEIQLRTRTMHEWAITVESLGGRLNTDLKSGLGPEAVLDLLSTVSEAMAIEEEGGIVGGDLIQRIGVLRAAAVPYIPDVNRHD